MDHSNIPSVLYRHVKRPEWGFSTIVSTQQDSTTFLFDDGRQRTIKIGHVHLMEVAVLMDDAAEEVHRKLAKYRRVKPSVAVAVKEKRSKSAAARARRPPSD